MAQVNPLTGTDVFARQQELAENQSDIKNYLVATLAAQITSLIASIATITTQLQQLSSDVIDIDVMIKSFANSGGKPWISN